MTTGQAIHQNDNGRGNVRELQDMLRVQARLHRKQGGIALGCLFENAGKEIGSLSERLAKANERVKELEYYNVALANESHEYQQRCLALDEIADTAFKYNHSSAECLRAWNKLQQLRKEQSNE